LLDRFGEPAIGAGSVANRRKATLQHAFEDAGRLQCHQRNRSVRQPV